MRARISLVPALLTLALALPALAAEKGAVSRTPSGHPDFSGTYDTATLTPMVRRREFGDNLYLTPDEADAIVEAENQFRANGSRVSDPGRDAPPEGGAGLVGQEDLDPESFGAGSVGGYNVFWIDRGTDVVSIDGKFRTSILFDPPNGQYPPLTEEAKAIRASRGRGGFRRNTGEAYWLEEGDGSGPFDNMEQRPLAERCILGFGSTQGPPMLPALYNNHKRIVQTDEAVLILVEMIHDARIVRMNAEHEPDDVRTWLGDSIGWWEGDTLVVETTNFREQKGFNGGSENMKVTERFTPAGDGDLLYRFTVDDPTVWTAPFSGEYLWPATSNKVYEYACHEGNYALGDIMRGARFLEREAQGEATGGGGE